MTEELDFEEAMDGVIEQIKENDTLEPEIWAEIDNMLVIVKFRRASAEELEQHNREAELQ
jgi:hypothetical protein